MAAQKSITTLACKRLEPRHILTEASPYRGLRLVASPRGPKVWQYRFRDAAGHMGQVKLGGYPTMGIADSRRLLDERKDAIRAGEPVKVVTRQPLKLARMVELYLTERVDVDRKEKGAKEVRRLFAVTCRQLLTCCRSSLPRRWRILSSLRSRRVRRMLHVASGWSCAGRGSTRLPQVGRRCRVRSASRPGGSHAGGARQDTLGCRGGRITEVDAELLTGGSRCNVAGVVHRHALR